MQQISDEAFRGFFALPIGGAGRFWQPPVDIHETEDTLLVKMELAGAKADDLQVSLSPDDRVLTISGARAEEPRRPARGASAVISWRFISGRSSGPSACPSGIPLDRDAITATYRDGFLLVTLPKRRAPESRRRA